MSIYKNAILAGLLMTLMAGGWAIASDTTKSVGSVPRPPSMACGGQDGGKGENHKKHPEQELKKHDGGKHEKNHAKRNDDGRGKKHHKHRPNLHRHQGKQHGKHHAKPQAKKHPKQHPKKHQKKHPRR